jgi:outer membrane protein OmpA-like peptidoglycan-associated protein
MNDLRELHRGPEAEPSLSSRFVGSKRLLISIALFFALTTPVRAEDCHKAKDIYRSAAKSLDLQERVAGFQKAVELCPGFPEAHVNLADSYEKLASTFKRDIARFNAMMDKAAAEYSKALKQKPGMFSAYLGLGDTYRVMGLYDRSEEAYKKALQVKPDDPRALLGLDKIKTIKTHDTSGFKTAEKIVKHFETSSGGTELGDLMGFADRTVVKDRLRFDNILFDEWSSQLNREEAIQQLQEIGKALSSPHLADTDFVVEGHTDNRGDHERNVRLSQERAEGVKKYLVERFKIAPQRIKTEGFGDSRPRVPNDSKENLLQNRRVEILFLERNTEN